MDPASLIQCDNCSAHFSLTPNMATDGMACPDCGGERLYRSQPSPTQSDGALRDMVDMDAGGVDRGDNPDGEGIAKPDIGKQDESFPASGTYGNHEASATKSVVRSLNMEPYDSWQYHEAAGGGLITPQQAQQGTSGGGGNGSLLPLAEGVGGAAGLAALNLIPGVGEAADAAAAGDLAAGGAVAGEGAAAGEAGLGGAAAGGAASGAASGLAGGVVKKLLPKAIGPLIKGALGLGAGGAGAATAEPVSQAPNDWQIGASVKDIPMILLGDFESPFSVPSVDEQHDDPFDQDQQQFRDGDNSPSNFHNPNLQDSGQSGEDNARSDSTGYQGFAENSPGIERAEMIMPLLMKHFHSPESGESDPLIRGLHEALEKESPGYLNQSDPEADQALQTLIEHHKNPSARGVHAGVNMAIPNHGMGKCAMCGSPLSPSGACTACGQTPGNDMAPGPGAIPPAMAHTYSAAHQGPVTPEQIAAVQQRLIDTNRAEECPNVPLHPEQYAKEMADIQNVPNVAPQVDPSQLNQTPPQAMPQAPGAMPMPDPSQAGAGGQPMMPMSATRTSVSWPWSQGGTDATPMIQQAEQIGIGHRQRMQQHDGQERLQQQDASYQPASISPSWMRYNQDQLSQDIGLPQEHPQFPEAVDAWRRGYSQPIQATAGKIADANNAVPRCPNCGSATTSVDAMGDASSMKDVKGHCHSCHTIFKVTKTADANNAVPRCPRCGTATTSVDIPGDPSSTTEPAGYCHGCGEVFDIAKKSRYVFADLVDVPNPNIPGGEPRHEDPNQLVWADNAGQHLIEGQTYELHSPAFPVPDLVRVMQVKPDAVELQLADGVGVQTGQPDIQVTRQEAQLQNYEFVPSHSDADKGMEPPSGTPGQSPDQVPPIETTDTPDVNPHTHASVQDPVTSDMCKCGSSMVDHTMSSPETTLHECVRCGSAWETRDDFEGRQSGVDLSWIREDSNDDFFGDMERAQAMAAAGSPSRNLSSIAAQDERLQTIRQTLDKRHEERTAGRHFTPSEKRDLIDEYGVARNLDDLELSGTHYTTSYDETGKANGDNVPDSHLLLGL